MLDEKQRRISFRQCRYPVLGSFLLNFMANSAAETHDKMAVEAPAGQATVRSSAAEAANAETQQVCFMLAGGEYGVDISIVGEIIKPTMDPTPVPQSPFFVEGVIDLRGDIIPIIDLKKRFGIQTREEKAPGRILVIKMTDIIVGFLVDSVTEVLRVRKNHIQDAPGKIVGVDREYIWGVTKRNAESPLIMLLDIEKVLHLDTEELRAEVQDVT